MFVAVVVLFGDVRGTAAQSGESIEPAAPLNVQVVAEGDGSLTVAWDVPELEEGQLSASAYRVLLRLAISEPGAQPQRWRWFYWPDRDVGGGCSSGPGLGVDPKGLV